MVSSEAVCCVHAHIPVPCSCKHVLMHGVTSSLSDTWTLRTGTFPTRPPPHDNSSGCTEERFHPAKTPQTRFTHLYPPVAAAPRLVVRQEPELSPTSRFGPTATETRLWRSPSRFLRKSSAPELFNSAPLRYNSAPLRTRVLLLKKKKNFIKYFHSNIQINSLNIQSANYLIIINNHLKIN